MRTRIVHTKFWEDSYIQKLTPNEKLLFIFLLTNGKVGLSGAYEITTREIEFITGIKGVEKMFVKFEEDGKVLYLDHYVVLINSQKYQDYSKGNKWQKEAYKRELELLPPHIKEMLLDEDKITSYLTSRRTSPITRQNINKNKNKNINKNKNKKQEEKGLEAEVVSQEEMELQNLVDSYNKIYGKNVTSTKGFETNFEYWREVHSIEKMERALLNARRDKFWKDKMTLTILFRRKNQNGEEVDYIQDLSERKDGGYDTAFIS